VDPGCRGSLAPGTQPVDLRLDRLPRAPARARPNLAGAQSGRASVSLNWSEHRLGAREHQDPRTRAPLDRAAVQMERITH
jgi:hypothetical protein